MDDAGGGDNWRYKLCKAPVKSSPPINQHPTFYRPDALPVAQPTASNHSTEGNYITFYRLAYAKLTWGLPTLSLTTNSSWLPWGRVAMPLISPQMPVPPPCLLPCTNILVTRMLTRDLSKVDNFQYGVRLPCWICCDVILLHPGTVFHVAKTVLNFQADWISAF